MIKKIAMVVTAGAVLASAMKKGNSTKRKCLFACSKSSKDEKSKEEKSKEEKSKKEKLKREKADQELKKVMSENKCNEFCIPHLCHKKPIEVEKQNDGESGQVERIDEDVDESDQGGKQNDAKKQTYEHSDESDDDEKAFKLLNNIVYKKSDEDGNDVENKI